ncbi:uncharacterized protein PSFLO_05701 [Pseudozyma flocculosa]|nr:uncharacterized protein PSFLO_05701 [Pseudozyma flocculosa]
MAEAQQQQQQQQQQPAQDDGLVLAYLILEDKKGRRKERFPITRALTTMGRSIDNDVRIFTAEVSRLHCSIEIDEETKQASMKVFGTNGVDINASLALPEPKGNGTYPLRTGDQIVVAKRRFRFELKEQSATSATASGSTAGTASPIKKAGQIAQTPATTRTRRVRMSLVNIAQLDTPAKHARPDPLSERKALQSSPPSSPPKAARRASRRLSGINLLLQGQIATGGPVRGRKSLSTLPMPSTSQVPCTPNVKGGLRNASEPKTAPPKQVSFNLFDGKSASTRPRMSPVKKMRALPPMPQMDEQIEDDEVIEDAQERGVGVDSLRAMDDEMREEELVIQKPAASAPVATDDDDDDDDLIVVEEVEEVETAALRDPHPSGEADNDQADDSATSTTPEGTPKTNRRQRRSSSFLGRAGPLKDVNLAFYSEERRLSEDEAGVQAAHEEHEHGLSNMPEEEMPDTGPLSVEAGPPPPPSPASPSPAHHLEPLPRRPSRMSSPTKRKVSLRTLTLLRSSAQYSDRLFVPPPPRSAQMDGGAWSMSKSSSMPSQLSEAFDSPARDPAPAAPDATVASVQVPLTPRRIALPLSVPGTPEYAREMQDLEDEDEVDRSLSLACDENVCAPSASNTKVMSTSTKAVTADSSPALAETRSEERKHRAGRASMSAIPTSDRRWMVLRAHFGQSTEATSTLDALTCLSPLKKGAGKKIVCISDIGLPPADTSMGHDLIEDIEDQDVVLDTNEEEVLAAAIECLFTAAIDEDTDDETDIDDEEEENHDRNEDGGRQPSAEIDEEDKENLPPTTVAPAVLATPPPVRGPGQSPACESTIKKDAIKSLVLEAVPHLPSISGVAPNVTGLNSLCESIEPLVDTASMFASGSDLRPPVEYGTLREKMRADPVLAELISPQDRAERKKLGKLRASPSKRRAAAKLPPKTPDMRGIKQLLAEPLPQKTPDMRGLRQLLAEPKVAAATPDVRFLRQVFALPATEVDSDPHLAAVKNLFKSHERALRSETVLDQHDEDGQALRDLMATPAAKKCISDASVSVSDVGKLFEVDELNPRKAAIEVTEEDNEEPTASPSVRKTAIVAPLTQAQPALTGSRDHMSTGSSVGAQGQEDPLPSVSSPALDAVLEVRLLDKASHEGHEELFDEVRRLSTGHSSRESESAPTDDQDEAEQPSETPVAVGDEPPVAEPDVPTTEVEVNTEAAAIEAIAPAIAEEETAPVTAATEEESVTAPTPVKTRATRAKAAELATPKSRLRGGKRAPVSHDVEGETTFTPAPTDERVEMASFEDEAKARSSDEPLPAVVVVAEDDSNEAEGSEKKQEFGQASSDQGPPATSPVKAMRSRTRKGTTTSASSPVKTKSTRSRKTAAAPVEEPETQAETHDEKKAAEPSPIPTEMTTTTTRRRGRAAKAKAASTSEDEETAVPLEADQANADVRKSKDHAEARAEAASKNEMQETSPVPAPQPVKTRTRRAAAAAASKPASSPVKTTRSTATARGKRGSASAGTKAAASEGDVIEIDSSEDESDNDDEDNHGAQTEDTTAIAAAGVEVVSTKKSTRSSSAKRSAIPAPKKTTRGRKAVPLGDVTNVAPESSTTKRSTRKSSRNESSGIIEQDDELNGDQAAEEEEKTRPSRSTRTAGSGARAGATTTTTTKKTTRSKAFSSAAAKSSGDEQQSVPSSSLPVRTTRSRAAAKK